MNGFTITILNQKITVKFLHPNKKVVVCFLNDGENEFKAVSKCNFDENDVYDPEFGEELALEKAFGKRNECYEKAMSKIEDKIREKLFFQTVETQDHYKNKLMKMKQRAAKREANKSFTNAQDETPPIEAYENN
jgi:hypothetical protein